MCKFYYVAEMIGEGELADLLLIYLEFMSKIMKQPFLLIQHLLEVPVKDLMEYIVEETCLHWLSKLWSAGAGRSLKDSCVWHFLLPSLKRMRKPSFRKQAVGFLSSEWQKQSYNLIVLLGAPHLCCFITILQLLWPVIRILRALCPYW